MAAATTDNNAEILRPGASLEEWDQFVDESPQGSIFCRSWWLEAACPNSYQIVVLRKGGKIAAGMPLWVTKQWAWEAARMPGLTQTWGPLLAPPRSPNPDRVYNNDLDLLNQLVAALPKLPYVFMACHYNVTNWLPFYWAGYSQSTYYTFVIEDIRDPAKALAGFNQSKMQKVRQAQEILTVEERSGSRAFYDYHVRCLGKQGKVIAYGYDLFQRIFEAAYAHGAGRAWYAVDAEGREHAAIFVVFDKKSAYYLINSVDPEHRKSSATTLLVKHAVEQLSAHTGKLDFEGSMIPGVAEFYKSFGSTPKSYYRLTLDRLPLPVRVFRDWRRSRSQD